MSLRNLFPFLKKAPAKNLHASLNGLDAKLEKYLNFNNGFFIEAGANDGYSQSNTYYLAKARGWRGLLVEGIPDLYEKCVLERKESAVVNCALVSSNFTDGAVVMHYANLMSAVEGALGSEEKLQEHIEAGISVQRLSGTYKISVPARTLESVLDDIPEIEKIDFLSLDVEGYELDVLDGLNIERYSPEYVLVEARFFEEVNHFLTEHQYELLEQLSVHDYIYRKCGSSDVR